MAKKSGGEKGKKKTSTRIKLQYAKHWFSPEDLLDFLELPPFTRRWEKLGLNDEQDLTALQLFIMTDPKFAPVVEGTNSLRKGRYSPPSWHTGKSGGLRVLYVYFEEYGIVLLCLVYDKTELSDISADVKKRLNFLVNEIETELKRRGTL